MAIAGLSFPTASLADRITIAALGDSLTQGYGLPDGDGLVPQLETWLQGQGADVKILNAGVSGDTTSGGLARLDWTLTPEVDGLIVTLGGNDLLRGLSPDLSRANIDGILSKAGMRDVPILLLGFKAPTNYGPDYKAEFDRIYPELAEKHGAILHVNYLAALQDGRDQADVLRDYMQADGIHPNKAGVALLVQAIGPDVLDLIAQIGR